MIMAASISAIIPTFNASPYIGDTLASLQNQTFTGWEAIVVDDGSTDNTADIVRRLAASDPRIVLLQQENKGEASARAAGVKRSTSELLYFLDADDIAMHDTLARLVHNFSVAADNVAVIYGDHLRIDARGALIFPDGKTLDKKTKPSGDVLAALLQRNLFAMGAACVRKHFCNERDMLIPSNYSEDWFMWVHLALKGNFLYLGGAPLVQYRLHRGNQTHEKVGIKEHGKAIDAVFSMPELQARFSAQELHYYRKKREAFCLFALGCKELRLNDYSSAAGLFRQSLAKAYWKRPAVWLIYAFAATRFLPRTLRQHLGSL